LARGRRKGTGVRKHRERERDDQKNQDHLKQVLLTNKIAFELIDVAASEAALKHMRKKSGKRDIPQVFVGGEFRGLYSDFLDAHQSGNLFEFLKPIEIMIEQRVEAREGLGRRPFASPPSSPRIHRESSDDEVSLREVEEKFVVGRAENGGVKI